MFCCGKGNDEEGGSEASERSRDIDAQLKRGKMALTKERKILLLGAGEAGKTTVLRQMQFIYANGLSDAARFEFTSVIRANALQSMQVILEAMHDRGMKLADTEGLREDANYINRLHDAEDTPHFGLAIAKLWQDAGVRGAFDQSHEYQLNDSAPYFFKHIERITRPDYVPTDDDLIRARVRTTGVSETDFHVNGVLYRIVDVGGQRSERRKWISVFSGVECVLFIVAISEYNLMLREDASQNRLIESLHLFASIVNSRFFSSSSIVLFQKIKTHPLHNYYTNAPQDAEWSVAANFLKDEFVNLNESPSHQIYPHLICATNTSQIQKLAGSLLDAMARDNMRHTGLV